MLRYIVVPCRILKKLITLSFIGFHSCPDHSGLNLLFIEQGYFMNI